jgi:hypothetical protein
MTKSESVHKQAGFLEKEVRRIIFSEIKKNDIAELYNVLKVLHRDQRKSKLWICMGRHDSWFNSPEEMTLFLQGFRVGMLLLDDDFLNDVGDAIKGRPKL